MAHSFNPFSIIIAALTSAVAVSGLSSSNLETHIDSLELSVSFNPVIDAYWTGFPHHRRTPFAVSPDGTTGYVAYLDSDGTNVVVQSVDPSTFASGNVTVTVTGAKEAGGLVVQDDGFALLTSEPLPSGTTDAPADSTPVAVLYRYDGTGNQVWKTWLGGPSIDDSMGYLCSPDINGDLVYSTESGYYGAYIVVTAYSGSAEGHYGDAIRYVKESTGELVEITGASSSWGCSHNTGIAIEEADEPPFATVCAEDQGAVWLNTEGQGMTTAGVKVSNEHVINGASNEPMGGMSGSYSALARLGTTYLLSWVSRGATTLSANEWMGDGYTTADNRTVARRVAVAAFSDKNTLVGDEASSTVGDTDGDKQITWISTEGSQDCSNAHVAAFGDGSSAVVTWEEIANPECYFDAMGCRGAYSGTKFVQVTSAGAITGEELTVDDVYVAGDMVTMSGGRICWPYVNMTWNLDAAGLTVDPVSKLSFACLSSGNGTTTATTTTTTAAPAVSNSAVALSSTENTVSGTEEAAVASQADTATVAATSTAAMTTAVATAVATSNTATTLITVTSPTSTDAAIQSSALSSSTAIYTPGRFGGWHGYGWRHN